MNVLLQRFRTSDQGTFGKIFIDDKEFCYSGELVWRDNESNVSCIPLGDYHCGYTLSPRLHKFTYEVFGVPKRAGIRIHSANFVGNKDKGFQCQAQGCIILGEKIGTMDRQQALLISRPAVTRFENMMERKPFLLQVRELYGNH